MSAFFEQENFEDFFRENLEGHESEPSKMLWSDLENKIPPKSKTDNGLVSFFLVLFLIFSIVTSTYFSTQENFFIQEYELEEKNSKSIVQDLSQDENSSNPKLSIFPTENLNKSVVAKPTPKLEKIEKISISTTINQQESSSQKIDNQAVKRIIKPKILLTAELDNRSNDLALFHSIKLIEKAPLFPILNNVSPQWQRSIPSEEKSKRAGTWLLEMTYSPNLWTSLKAKKESYQLKQSIRNAHQSANYGILLTERGKNGWGFECGLMYGNYHFNHTLDHSIEFSYLNNFLDENDVLTGTYLLNIKSPFWKDDRPVHIKYFEMRPPFIQDGERIQLTGNYTQHIKNLQLPVGANYQIELNENLNAILQSGLIFGFLSVQSGSFSEAHLSNESLQIVEAEEANKQSSQNLEAYIGLGLEYNLSNRIRFKISPRYSTIIWNNLSGTNQINLTSFQLNLGLSYPLEAFGTNN